ncbi:programmed cell death 1 ligand 1-like isoform X1 [Epinephelus lanceolatus]
MMCIILLLINLTSCVCGTFVVNVTQTSYQAEENHNITLEWMFTTLIIMPLNSLTIYCEMVNNLKISGLFHLHGGVEVPESQDEQFTGRVQCDKDVLREGRLRLHVSRLRTDDSGVYVCQVVTHNDVNFSERYLNVTAARERPKPETPNTASGQQPAAALLGLCVCLFIHFLFRE